MDEEELKVLKLAAEIREARIVEAHKREQLKRLEEYFAKFMKRHTSPAYISPSI